MAADAKRALTTAYTALGYISRGHRYSGPELTAIRTIIQQGLGALIGTEEALKHVVETEQRYRDAADPEVAPVEEQIETVRSWGWFEGEDGTWHPPSPGQQDQSAGQQGATEEVVSSPEPAHLRKPLSPDLIKVYVRQATDWLFSSVPEDAGPIHVSQLLRVAAELEGHVGQLILEVLAARHRSGEQVWTFSDLLEPMIERLEESGLVSSKSGVAEGTLLVRLTGEGRAAALSETYRPSNRRGF